MLSNKPRHWFRFRLATLLAAVTVISLWLGWQTYSARRQRDAVAAIIAAEGTVFYDDAENEPLAKAAAAREPSIFDRLKNSIGSDYFRSAVVVGLSTNNGRRRGTREPKATPEVLAQLAKLPRVETLEISHNETVTDERLIHLSGMKRLKTLYLYRTPVRGPGLAHLVGLRNLESLELGHAPLSDEGLAWIGQMQRLRWLRMENTHITDAGIVHLATLTSLETLSLKNTDVTDECLKYLARLKGLKELTLTQTRITSAGAEWIRQALPACQVSTTFSLGKFPQEINIVADGVEPTADLLAARFKELGIDGQAWADPNMAQGPVVRLWLGNTMLSDESVLTLIALLPMLEQISFRRGLVGDKLARGLVGRDLLTYLELSETQISDAGLAHIATLPNLRELEFSNAQITDVGLRHLHALKNLRRIGLRGTRVSDEGIRELKQALPDCAIYR